MSTGGRLENWGESPSFFYIKLLKINDLRGPGPAKPLRHNNLTKQ
jgi:hypothetical protein